MVYMISNPAQIYEKSPLSELALTSIEKELDKLMQSEKLYINGDLKLQELSKRTGYKRQ